METNSYACDVMRTRGFRVVKLEDAALMLAFNGVEVGCIESGPGSMLGRFAAFVGYALRDRYTTLASEDGLFKLRDDVTITDGLKLFMLYTLTNSRESSVYSRWIEHRGLSCGGPIHSILKSANMVVHEYNITRETLGEFLRGFGEVIYIGSEGQVLPRYSEDVTHVEIIKVVKFDKTDLVDLTEGVRYA